MQSKTTVVVLYNSVVLILLLHGSVCGDPVSNSGKHEAKYRDGPDGDLRPDPHGNLRPGSDRSPVAVPICAEDEYYDVNVHACSRCSDICRPNIDLTFCTSNCREYLRNHFDSSLHHSSSSVVTISPSPGGAREERLTEKPLFWTSIVSMTIAVAATAAIIVLCVRRRKPRRNLGERMEPSEQSFRGRTLSETSDDKDPEQRTLLRNTSGDSARTTTSCGDGRRDYDDLGNQSTYIPGGGGGGHTMDRFGGSGGVCHQNDRSNLPTIPSPDRYPSPEKVPVSPTYVYTHTNSIDDDDEDNNNARNVYENPVKVNIWTSHKPNGKESNPIITSESEKKRQWELEEGPLWSFSSSTSHHSQETSYASLINEASRAKEKRLLTYLGEEDDETCVKQNRFVDLQSPTRIPRQGEGVSMEPIAMGILTNNANSLVDIRRLEVSVRTTTENDNQPPPPSDHCPKSKTILFNSPSSPCDDGIASGINEPN